VVWSDGRQTEFGLHDIAARQSKEGGRISLEKEVVGAFRDLTYTPEKKTEDDYYGP